MGRSDEPSVESLLRDFRDTLLSMHESRIVERQGDPKVWNRLVNHLQVVQLKLRETAEGMAGISALMSDENATVQQWCASYALDWDPEPARTLLEGLVTDDLGMAGFEAKMTLREFDAGRLNSTWQPKGRP